MINLALCMDTNYVSYGLASLLSIERHTEDELNVFILTDESTLPEIDRYKRHLRSKITPIIVDSELVKSATPFRYGSSLVTYYRILLGDYLPKDLDKVLYLDSDILVLDDISNLYNTEVSTIAGVKDLGIDRYNTLPSEYRVISNDRSSYIKLDLSGNINPGVLLINLDDWRSNEITKRSLELLNTYKLQFHDQDIINILYEGKIQYLPLKWNIQANVFTANSSSTRYKYYLGYQSPSSLNNRAIVRNTEIDEEELKDAISNPSLVHFVLSKPWDSESDSYISEEYLKYREKWITYYQSLTGIPIPTFSYYHFTPVEVIDDLVLPDLETKRLLVIEVGKNQSLDNQSIQFDRIEVTNLDEIKLLDLSKYDLISIVDKDDKLINTTFEILLSKMEGSILLVASVTEVQDELIYGDTLPYKWMYRHIQLDNLIDDIFIFRTELISKFDGESKIDLLKYILELGKCITINKSLRIQ